MTDTRIMVTDPAADDANHLPHHFVTKDSSTATKLGVVFDASAKTTLGVSLNDQLMIGPRIQDDIFDIILRFRGHKYAFTADIAKMYRQILICEEDRKWQHIVWRDNPDVPMKVYQLNTVTCGTAAAPFLAVRT